MQQSHAKIKHENLYNKIHTRKYAIDKQATRKHKNWNFKSIWMDSVAHKKIKTKIPLKTEARNKHKK